MPKVTERPRLSYDEPYQESAVHAAFGLTYASYLVYPRAILEAMPYAWQEKLIALLDELHETFEGYEPPGGYSVHAKDERHRFTRDPLRDYRHPDRALIRSKVRPRPE